MARGKVDPRGQKHRAEKPVVVIITEGSQTEPKYFTQFKSRNSRVNIDVLPNKGNSCTDYESLLKKAVRQLREKGLSAAKGDSLWIVADVDIDWNTPGDSEVKRRQLAALRAKAERAGVKLAITNPCFELWFLLHYEYTTAELKDCEAVQKKLERYISDYAKNKDIFERLYDRLDQALWHAERLEQYHIQHGGQPPFGVDCTPFTEVSPLICQIR